MMTTKIQKVNILGTAYMIKEQSVEENVLLDGLDGYCDRTIKEIIIRRENQGNFGDMESYVKEVKRHEIIHAFLAESGLDASSGACECWANNEEMVDWFAMQGLKIYKAWEEAGAV